MISDMDLWKLDYFLNLPCMIPFCLGRMFNLRKNISLQDLSQRNGLSLQYQWANLDFPMHLIIILTWSDKYLWNMLIVDL